MSASDIIRITTGTLNQVDDVQIGQSSTPMGPDRSSFQGQLGKWFDLDDDDVIFDASIDDVFPGGRFQYVRLALAAPASPVLGQILFWDNSVANNLYQVTTDEDLSSNNPSSLIAGINLNPTWTPGNYGLIKILGDVTVRFRAVLTTAGSIGCPVYAAAAGGADEGFADVVTDDALATVNARYLGKAIDMPIGGQTALVSLIPLARRF